MVAVTHCRCLSKLTEISKIGMYKKKSEFYCSNLCLNKSGLKKKRERRKIKERRKKGGWGGRETEIENHITLGPGGKHVTN